ncbi:MAG: hypothetical protein ACTSRS_09005 [Candidatus Helarchaeota archaeon]
MNGEGTRWIPIAALLVIIACFLPWWGLFSEAIPSGYDKTYTLFLSTPLFGDYQTLITVYTANSNVFDLFVINTGFLDRSIPASVELLIAVIISLLGGVVGLLSFRRKKGALIGGVLAIVGVALYMVFITMGILPAGVDASYFESQGLNPLFGTFTRNPPGTTYNHLFGLSIGCIGALVFGVILFLSAFKGKD